MADEPERLGRELEVRVDEARLARGWSAIERGAFGSRRPRRLAPLLAASLVVAAAAALALGLWRARDPGPLTLAGGGSLEPTVSAARGGVIDLEDGSHIALTDGTRLQPIESTGSRFGLLLHEGEARFEVEPGGPRRWVIEAGALSVEVVGTVFTVRRRDGRVRVAVERGRVLVRGDRLPERVRLLEAGDAVEVEATELAAAPPSSAPPSSAASSSPSAAPETETSSALTVAPEPAEPAAPEPAPPAPTRVEAPSQAPAPTAATLLAEADAARRAGEIDEALATLRVASRRAGDPDAALAGFTRGRLAQEHGRAAEAVADFERALRVGLPAALAESARHRLIAAHAATGDPEAARSAARDYLRRYPDGTYRQDAEEAL